MDEYISREAAVNFAKHAYNEWNLAMAAADGQRQINLVYKRQELCKAVESVFHDVPAADVAAVVHSHWEVAIGYDPKKKVQCQHCKLMNYEPEDYCPHCGARMDEKDGEQNE